MDSRVARIRACLEEWLALNLAFEEGEDAHDPAAIDAYVAEREGVMARCSKLMAGDLAELMAGPGGDTFRRIEESERRIAAKYAEFISGMLADISGNQAARRAFHSYQKNSGVVGVPMADVQA